MRFAKAVLLCCSLFFVGCGQDSANPREQLERKFRALVFSSSDADGLRVHLGYLHENWEEAIEQMKDLPVTELAAYAIRDEDVRLLKRLPKLKKLDFKFASSLSDTGLFYLDELNIDSLSLYSTNISGKGLYYIGCCRSIRSLDLINTKITDDGLVYLRGLPLESLSLPAAAVTDSGIEKVVEQFGPTLRELSLDGTEGLSEAGMTKLSTLRGLERLTVKSLGLGDHGFRQIGSLRNLKSLEIFYESEVTATGFKELSRLTELEYLYLACVENFDDKELEHLKGLSKLRTLCFHSAGITNEGLSALANLEALSSLSCWFTYVNSDGRSALPQVEKFGVRWCLEQKDGLL